MPATRYCPQCNAQYSATTGVCANHPEPVPAALAAGTVIQGNNTTYTLTYLGAGAMGVAYKATDNATGATLVVKELLPVNDPTGQADRLRRFQREARVQAMLSTSSGDIPFPRGYGHFTEPTVGREVMVMEFVQGRDLAKVLKQQGPLDRLTILQIGIEMCDALAYLHNFVDPRTGKKDPIVHRDLKPDNIMVVPVASGDTYKLIDFGIARSAIKSPGTLAKGPQGTIAGTGAYWAPEQVGAGTGQIDGRTDIYILGGVLYELQTGKQFDKVIRTRVADLTANVGDPDLQGLLKKMIDPKPDRRFQTVEELRVELVKVYETIQPLPAHLQAITATPTPVPTPAPTSTQSTLGKIGIEWDQASPTRYSTLEWHQDLRGQVVASKRWWKWLRKIPVSNVSVVPIIHDVNNPSPLSSTPVSTDLVGRFELEWDDTTVPMSVARRIFQIRVEDSGGNLLHEEKLEITQDRSWSKQSTAIPPSVIWWWGLAGAATTLLTVVFFIFTLVGVAKDNAWIWSISPWAALVSLRIRSFAKKGKLSRDNIYRMLMPRLTLAWAGSWLACLLIFLFGR